MENLAQNVHAHKSEHTPEKIQRRLADDNKPSYLKDFILGALDGIVTTFAIISGVVGAELSSGIVIILGLANLIADGFSMGMSNYLGVKADNQHHEQLRNEEEQHIDLYPEGEKEEVRQIFHRKGFHGETLEHIVQIISSQKKHWIDLMMTEEHGHSLVRPSALRSGLATFIAFIIVGAVPILAFVVNWINPEFISNTFFWSCALTAIAFIAVGAYKSSFMGTKWYIESFETLAVGGVAASIAYFIGKLLKGLAVVNF